MRPGGQNSLLITGFTYGRKKENESLKAVPEFSSLRVSKPMLASIPPVPAATLAVTKS
jgi:hypothetical protein